ncbi:hypothetical protein ACVWZB_004750 [Paenibacillus polymyxa]
MGSNASQAMKTAIGIILTVALASMIIGIFMLAAGWMSDAKDDMNDSHSEVADSKYMMYESTNLSGSEVVNAIRKYARKPEFKITIKTLKDGGTVYTKGDVGETKNVTSSKYVNPSGIFAGKLDRDANNVVMGITFTQQ